MLGVAITPADVPDSDGFIPLLKEVRRVFVFLQRIFADGADTAERTPPQRQTRRQKSNFAGRRHQRCR